MNNWESNILALTYEDRMDVYRTKEVTDDETGISDRVEKKIYTNISCALSKKNNPIITQGEPNNHNVEHVVFCNPEINIENGDRLVITRYKKNTSYIASAPFKYYSHTEIPVTGLERV